MTLVNPVDFLGLLLAGVAAGLFGSMLGVGGGILIVPALVLLFDVPVHYAIGSSIMTVIATSSMSGSFHLEKGTVNIRLGMVLEVATAFGGLAGGLVAGAVPGDALTVLFAVVLLPIGVLMWRRSFSSGREIASVSDYRLRRLPLAMGLSLGAGAVSGLLGIGGGIIKVPALTLFCGVPPRVAAATSTFMIGVTAVASAFLYLGRGQVRPVMTAMVITGVLAGSAGGTLLAGRLRNRQIARLFTLFIWFSAIQMLYRGIRGIAP